MCSSYIEASLDNSVREYLDHVDKNSRLETNVHDGADQKIMKHTLTIVVIEDTEKKVPQTGRKVSGLHTNLY